ncbi:hypothetical protein TSAR_016306 [Trichomalopsis sarcophagae]|uniref:Uncharacterized protein n=1 Tax=Trichomalopsis sarcophagae TaxID=543379 RepID=A0A232ESC0_9HYME|nr:hypothetical protein TSAR_016306 [Trichomalopsis sarcophagae]
MPVLRKSFAAKEQNEKLKTNNKEKEHEKEANEAEVAAKEKQREIKVFPNIITTHSRIQIKKSAIKEAYSHKEPSKFYINMMYAAWGRHQLSQRCVKKNKKTKDLKKLSPKKKRAVREHFEHFLTHYQYPNVMYSHYLGLANNYARRAINGAKSHVKMIEEYPELHSENEEDPDMTEL